MDSRVAHMIFAKILLLFCLLIEFAQGNAVIVAEYKLHGLNLGETSVSSTVNSPPQPVLIFPSKLS
jgi:hypothetical protein